MTPDELAIQDALGERFRIDREIGRGGMAVVYLAYDQRAERQVAIKVLRQDLIDASSAERFQREIRLEGRLQHPHILPIYESGSAGNLLYYVMPFVEGETLGARLVREGPLDVGDAIRIGREVAEALACAHAQGIIHRDVKPGNILLSGGHAVLADFGVARAVAEVAGEVATRSGIVLGTPTYMSPEQADSAGKVDERSDIYSLGCVLYEMLAGEPPFTGRTSAAIFAKHYSEPVPSLDVVRPGLAPELIDTVTKSLAKVPADRFRTAQGLVDALDVSATAATRPGTRSRRRPISRRLLLIQRSAIAAVTLLGIWFGSSFIVRPELDPHTVVVFPLENSRAQSADVDGGDTAIGTALDIADAIQAYPAWNWLTPVQRAYPAQLAPRNMRKLSKRLRARYYITGSVERNTGANSISVSLVLNDLQSDSIVHEHASGTLGESLFEEVALEAAGKLVPWILDRGRAVDLSLITDRKPSAIAYFVQGERYYRLAQFDRALKSYTTAFAEDSLIVFAALKGAQAANWSHDTTTSNTLLEQALPRRSELPPKYQHFLDGLNAYVHGAADEALAKLSAALAIDSSWTEAAMLMGEVHQHLLPRRVAVDSAITHFEKAARDLDFSPPLIHLAEHAIREGRIRDAKNLRAELEANHADPETVNHLEPMIRCVQGGPDDVDLPALEKKRVFHIAVLLSAGAQQIPCARAAADALLLADAWSTTYSWAAAELIQGLMIAAGKADSATIFMSSLLHAADRSQNPVLQGAKPGSMFVAVFDAAAGIEMPNVTSGLEPSAHELYGTAYERIRGLNTPWALGTWHVLHRERAKVTTLRDYFVASAALYDAPPQVAQRAAALSAHLLLMDGDTSGAINGFDRLKSFATSSMVRDQPAASFAWERILLARFYLDREQYHEAHDVAAAFDHPGSPIFLAFVRESLQIRRDAALGMHDTSLAERYSKRLRTLGRTDLIAAR